MKSVFNLFSLKWFLIIILFVSTIIRLCWIFVFDSPPTGDAEWFYQAACLLADGEGYVYQDASSAFYPPGYPLFLSVFFIVFGKSVLLAKILNVLLYAVILWVFWLIGRVLFKNNLAAGIAVFILAFYPNHIAYCNLLNNELFFLTVFIIATYFQLLALKQGRKVYFLLSGIFFGISCLTRPATAMIPFIIFGFHFLFNIKQFKIKQLTSIALFILTFLLVISPWQIRNKRVFSHFVFISSSFNHNLLVGNNPQARGNYMLMNDYLKQFPRIETEMEYDSFAFHQAISYIKDNPKEAISRIPAKVFYFLWPGMDGISWNMNGVSQSKYQFLHRFRFLSNGYYLLLLMGFVSIILFRILAKSGKLLENEWLFLLIMTYYLLISIVLFGESRFHFHLIPLMIWFIAKQISKLEIHFR